MPRNILEDVIKKGRENKRRNLLFMAGVETAQAIGEIADLTGMRNSTNSNAVNRRDIVDTGSCSRFEADSKEPSSTTAQNKNRSSIFPNMEFILLYVPIFLING